MQTRDLEDGIRRPRRSRDLMSERGKGNSHFGLESFMAESGLRVPDPGARLGVSSCLGKYQKNSRGARKQPFSGKSFYLDLPAGKNLQFLTGAIQQLGGVIEGFLSKEVSYIVSSRREAKAESGGTGHRSCPSSSEIKVETFSVANPKGSHTRPSQKPAYSVPMSRGKELLQKAIRKQGSSSGRGSGSSSSLLINARSWGVRVLHVDEMTMHVQQLTRGSSCVEKQEPKQREGTRPGVESRTRKVARLKAPFLKIEDVSRKFRPFHHQFKSFPEISFLGPKDASPFEAPTTPGSSHRTRELKDREPSLQSAARTMPRRRKGYCECCQGPFEELHVHLQSAQHQGFALEAHPYAEVDRIIAQLSHSFADVASQASLPRQSDSTASECDPLCPETSSPSQPSHPGVASPWMSKEDDCQAPSTPGQDATVDSAEASPEPAGTGQVPGPVASCQELGGPVDVFVDPSGTPVSRSPTYQHLLTSSGLMDLSSGPDSALVGHKRKIQFPSGSAEKRPGASFLAPGAPSPCGTRTTGSRHLLSLPHPGCESKPRASLLPFCYTQACFSLPDPLPWQSTDRAVEFTQPLWPRGEWPPGPEDSECTAPGPIPCRPTDSPAAPQAPASCRPTCTPPREGLQGARPPHSPILGQPAWEPAAPDGSGPLRLSKSLSPCLPVSGPTQCWPRAASVSP
ncbi:protein DBF4 homolog B isoform X1 [Sciurus carolinensis]|uniref:protein DBF4 homolog B isoform X1 n=2 Tax=Sciurus carolinensis TaxID=30640 RepID=UPI001FB2CF6B|nr:protein DBF4 homolog B isoform X1 [Sciurus carolinensis]